MKVPLYKAEPLAGDPHSKQALTTRREAHTTTLNHWTRLSDAARHPQAEQTAAERSLQEAEAHASAALGLALTWWR